jgi:hypothetical protein
MSNSDKQIVNLSIVSQLCKEKLNDYNDLTVEKKKELYYNCYDKLTSFVLTKEVKEMHMLNSNKKFHL